MDHLTAITLRNRGGLDMCLLKKIVISLALLAALTLPISASGMGGSSGVGGSVTEGCMRDPITGEMTCLGTSGSPGGLEGGVTLEPTGEEPSGTIIVTTSGGYSEFGGYPTSQGGYYQGQQGGFSSGYSNPYSGGIRIGNDNPPVDRFGAQPVTPKSIMKELKNQWINFKASIRGFDELLEEETDPDTRETIKKLQLKDVIQAQKSWALTLQLYDYFKNNNEDAGEDPSDWVDESENDEDES
jgi:hypothetical protein